MNEYQKMKKNETKYFNVFGADRSNLLLKMLQKLPKGTRTLATLIDEMSEKYGSLVAITVDKKTIMGLSILHENKIGCSFTLGLEEVKIK